MAVKDFSKLLTENLVISIGGKTYSVEPPSKDDGKVMMAINIAGVRSFAAVAGTCEVCGRSGETDMDPTMQALMEANAGRDLGEMSLTNCYEEMCADLDGPTVSKLEMYAFYYWTLGEKFADQWLAESGVGETPKAPAHHKSGRNTGSVKSSATQKTGRRSTPTTASRKK